MAGLLVTITIGCSGADPLPAGVANATFRGTDLGTAGTTPYTCIRLFVETLDVRPLGGVCVGGTADGDLCGSPTTCGGGDCFVGQAGQCDGASCNGDEATINGFACTQDTTCACPAPGPGTTDGQCIGESVSDVIPRSIDPLGNLPIQVYQNPEATTVLDPDNTFYVDGAPCQTCALGNRANPFFCNSDSDCPPNRCVDDTLVTGCTTPMCCEVNTPAPVGCGRDEDCPVNACIDERDSLPARAFRAGQYVIEDLSMANLVTSTQVGTAGTSRLDISCNDVVNVAEQYALLGEQLIFTIAEDGTNDIRFELDAQELQSISLNGGAADPCTDIAPLFSDFFRIGQ